MSGLLIAILIAVAIGLTLAAVLLWLVNSAYRKVAQGQALIINKLKSEPSVTFTGGLVLPVLHKAEMMDISVRTITLDRKGKDGLICRDNIRADISVNFFIRVNNTEEDVRRAAQLGVDRVNDGQAIEKHFTAKFAEALKTAGRGLDFVELYEKRQEFRDEIIRLIARDLDGFVLTDVAIDYLEQTPLHSLDSNNILDSAGIRKITDLTMQQNVATNILRNDEKQQVKSKDVSTAEALLELERQQAEATARQRREVESTQAREEAATAITVEEERLRAEAARISTEQAIAVQQENLRREVAVAELARERVVAVESESIEKARALEVITRDVETTAARLPLETEKRNIAEAARDRVSVERGVAEQEEAIATLRVVQEAERAKTATVLEAEALAQSDQVATIKAAEAAETAAQHTARQRVTLAQADLESANLSAQAQARLAEGVRATEAAPGLAAVEVRRAEADAIEKVGLAEVAIKTADADAVRQMGEAEGAATAARIKGEAEGLVQKAEAMKRLEGVSKDHEEFRLQLEADTRVRVAAVDADVQVAKARADAVAASMSGASVQIVGGTDMFVDQMIGATGRGKGLDAALNGSAHARTLIAPYLDGGGNLVGDLAAALGGNGAAGLRDLTLSALLAKAAAGDGVDAARLGRLQMAVADAGLGDTPLADLVR